MFKEKYIYRAAFRLTSVFFRSDLMLHHDVSLTADGIPKARPCPLKTRNKTVKGLERERWQAQHAKKKTWPPTMRCGTPPKKRITWLATAGGKHDFVYFFILSFYLLLSRQNTKGGCQRASQIVSIILFFSWGWGQSRWHPKQPPISPVPRAGPDPQGEHGLDPGTWPRPFLLWGKSAKHCTTGPSQTD